MHKRINKQISAYVANLKAIVKKKAEEDGIPDAKKIENMIVSLYDHPTLVLTAQDFQKRQRAKNLVPHFQRCNARRANGLQCTRRKKENQNYCGTHIKGRPHGDIELNLQSNAMQTIEIWVQDIGGIQYYIDANHNVYDPQDIYQRSETPTIIHKWTKDDSDNYQLI